jgi:hypothetical protein
MHSARYDRYICAGPVALRSDEVEHCSISGASELNRPISTDPRRQITTERSTELRGDFRHGFAYFPRKTVLPKRREDVRRGSFAVEFSVIMCTMPPSQHGGSRLN